MQVTTYAALMNHPEQFTLKLSYTGNLAGRRVQSTRDRGIYIPSDGLSRTNGSGSHAIQLPLAFTRIVAVQLNICATTGFGDYSIHSEIVANRRYKVCIKAGPSYIFYLQPEDLEPINQWGNTRVVLPIEK